MDLLPVLGPRAVTDARRVLDAQQLLLVVPLVERLRLVEPFVALEAHELGTTRRSDGLGELGLPDPCRPFDEDGFLEPVREQHDRRGRVVGEIARGSEPGPHVVHVTERRAFRGDVRGAPVGHAEDLARTGAVHENAASGRWGLRPRGYATRG